MAHRRTGRALSAAVLASLAAPAHAEDLGAMIAALDGRVCSLDGIPEADRMLMAPKLEERVHLYLRCTLKGRDEFVRTECCEHFTSADTEATGLCPSNPTTEALVRGLKKDAGC
jgi:hypothetical protein